jgi:8-oxo-dGTP pyrophosphatase MutT (NUDIX family)
MSSVITVNSIDRVGAVYLLRSDGAALMQLRDNKPGLRHAGQWVPPGGHAEQGEESEECARREFYEETNYRCDVLHKFIEIKDRVGNFEEYLLVIFFGIYDSKQEFICQEGQQLRFICRHEVNNYPMPDYLLRIWDEIIEQANLRGLINCE